MMADHTLSEPFTPTDSIAPTVSPQLLNSLLKIINIKIPKLYSLIDSSYLVFKLSTIKVTIHCHAGEVARV